ncbi:MAG: hypothetical protein KKA64_04265 [Nanoarchaeota archaeon]|nr:hypothetical protein [Nanoarchaeota archaeon]
MEKEDISLLKEGYSYLKNPEKTGKPLNKEAIDNLGVEKINSLKSLISEIQNLIENRETLSEDIFEDGEQLKTELNNFITECEGILPKDPDKLKEIIKTKNDLRQKKMEIAELQLNEKIGCWKDIALLKKEMRENQRELSEREARIKMLSEILEGE